MHTHIYRVCYRFPREISEITLDSEKLHREINFGIRNIHGYRGPLFGPYMVFKDIVKKEIKRLKQPVLKIIDLVVAELTSAVRICTQNVSNDAIF